MINKINTLWRLIRRLSGDDAYEQYLQYYERHHQNKVKILCQKPLSKAKFFKQWQDEKWNGIKRCC
jgi:uncharacterized short protein YbdD (DUF466 family)